MTISKAILQRFIQVLQESFTAFDKDVMRPLLTMTSVDVRVGYIVSLFKCGEDIALIIAENLDDLLDRGIIMQMCQLDEE